MALFLWEAELNRLYLPTSGLGDWRRLLANPTRQWRATRSAYELAVAWEAAAKHPRGIPPDIALLFDNVPEFRGAALLIGIPEHQVSLPGGGHASQTDLWALIKAPIGIVSVAVESKAGETFAELVPDWLAGRSERSGKPKRLAELLRILGLTEEQAYRCRYQLLHRAAAAIIEAKRFGLANAVLLVQSFAADPRSAADYECFGEQLGIRAVPGEVTDAGLRDGVRLWLAWVSSVAATDQAVREAIA